MAPIATLRQAERVVIDPERLVVLVRDLGEAGAERVLDRAVKEISCRLLAVETSWAEGDCARIARTAHSLIAIADQVGMHLLAHVACDVAALARSGDAPGLSATVARLQRVGEGSLLAMWGVENIRL